MVMICIKNEDTKEMCFLGAPNKTVARRVCMRSLSQLKKEDEGIIYDLRRGIYVAGAIMAFFTDMTVVMS
jgi:hypothetical protein